MSITAALCPPDPVPPRPSCLCCDRSPAAPRRLTCDGCARALAETLTDIVTAYGRLGTLVAPGSTGSAAGRGAPGFGSRSPARDDVLALLVVPLAVRAGGHVHADPDTLRNARTGAAPPLVVLGAWADRAREDGVLPPLRGARTVAGECLRLSGVLDALRDRWWIADLLADLRDVRYRLRRATDGDEHTTPVGRCPEFDLEHDRPCGGQVYARPAGDRAHCRACGHRWTGTAAVAALGEQLGDAMLDLPALARHLDVDSVPLLRKWAQRDAWARERVGGRTLYRLADARASARRAWERAHPVQGPALPPGVTVPVEAGSVAA